MQGIVNFFSGEDHNVANLKVLAATEIPMVMRYSREACLTVSLHLSSDLSIHVKLVEDMCNSYDMGKNNYPQTLPKMQNPLTNWLKSAWTEPIPPTGGLAFSQDWKIGEGTGPTNDGHSGR